MEQPDGAHVHGGTDAALQAVDQTCILPYFLDEAQKQDGSDLAVSHHGLTRKARRTLRMPSLEGPGNMTMPQARPRAVPRIAGRASTPPADSMEASAPNQRRAEWLATSLESALRSSDALPLVSHLRTLASRIFSEKASAVLPARSSDTARPLPRSGRAQMTQARQEEEAIRLACDLAEENSYLRSFLTSDSHVLLNAELAKAKRQQAAVIETNKRLQEQAGRDRQLIVELELRSRAFAEAYAWLTSHNRMISVRDAPALVALWRKRVASAGAAGQGTVVSGFTKDLAAAYSAADSERDTEAGSEDGRDKGELEARLLAAEVREAEAVSEATQAWARAELAEQRAAAAEKLLEAARAELETLSKLESGAVASPTPLGAAAAAQEAQQTASVTSQLHDEVERLQAALTASQRRVDAAESQCLILARKVKELQAALDATVAERQRREAEKANAAREAEAELRAQAERHAAVLEQLQEKHVEDLRGARQEALQLRQKLDETLRECDVLKSKLTAASPAGDLASRSKVESPKDTTTADISTLSSERDSYKAIASRLETDNRQLKARADEAVQLEKMVATLRERLAAGEELKKAYEVLQSETEALRGKLRDAHAAAKSGAQPTLGVPKKPSLEVKKSPPTASEDATAALTKECTALRESLRGLEQQVQTLQKENEILKKQEAALLQAAKAAGKAPVPAEKAPPVSKPLPPGKAAVLPKPGDTAKVPSPPGLPASRAAGEAPANVKDEEAAKTQAKLEQEIALLREQLVAAEEHKKAREALAKQLEEVQKDNEALANTTKAQAKLEQEIVLLRGQLVAAEEHKTAREALAKQLEGLQKENEALSNTIKTLKELPTPTSKAGDKGPAEADVDAIAKERDEWKERVQGLEKELAVLRASAKASEGLPAPPKLPAGDAKTLPPSKKPLGPLSKTGMPAAGIPAAGDAVDEKGAPGDIAKSATPLLAKPKAGLLPPKAKVAPPEVSEPHAGETAPASELLKKGPLPAGKPLVSKLPPKPGKVPPSGGKPTPGEEAASPGEDIAVKKAEVLAKSSKNGDPASPKTPAEGTKVAAPPKKASPVEPAPVKAAGFSADEKERLEKEIASLREKIAAAEELRKAHEALQKETEDLRVKLELERKAKPSGPAGSSVLAKAPDFPAQPSAADLQAVTKERDSLQEKVRALEEKLASMQAPRSPPSNKQQPPPFKPLPPGKVPLSKQPGDLGKSVSPSAPAVSASGASAKALGGEEKAADTQSKLEQEVALLRKQLSGAEELKNVNEALKQQIEKLKEEKEALAKQVEQLQRENEALKKEQLVKSPPSKAAELPGKAPVPAGKAQAASESPELGKAAPLPRPKPPVKAGPAPTPPASRVAEEGEAGNIRAELEKEISALRQQLVAAEKLGKAHEALAKQVEELKQENNALRKEGERLKEAPTPTSKAGDKVPTEADVAAIQKERDTLKERVEGLEKELAALRAKAPEGQAASPKSPAGDAKTLPPIKKPPAPLPKTKTPAAAAPAEADALAEEGAPGGDAKAVEPPKAKPKPGALPPKAQPALSKFPAGEAKTLPPGKKPPAPLPAAETPPAAAPVEADAPAEEGGQGDTAKASGPPRPKPKPGVLPLKAEAAPPEGGAGDTPAASGFPKKELLVVKPKPGKALPSGSQAAPEQKAALLAEDVPAEKAEPFEKAAKSKVPPPPKALAKDTKVAAPLKKAPLEQSPSPEEPRSTGAGEMADLEALRLKAEAAAKLEEEVASMREQLAAGARLRQEHEALQKETEALKSQLRQLQMTLKQPAGAAGAKAAAPAGTQEEGGALTAGEGAPENEPAAAKVVLKAPAKSPPAPLGKKHPPPLPKPGKPAGAPELAASGPPAEGQSEQDAPAAKGATPAIKKLPPSKAILVKDVDSGSLPPGDAAVKRIGSFGKVATGAVAAPLKAAAKDTELAASAKKAEAASGSGKAREELEEEIARLREQLAGSEELQKAHKALQENVKELQDELKAIKDQTKPEHEGEEGGGKSSTDTVETGALRKERDALKQRVEALEGELSSLRASGQVTADKEAAPPKSKGAMPLKAKPAKAKAPALAEPPGAGKSPMEKDTVKKALPDDALDKGTLLKEEVLSKSDAETAAEDSGEEKQAAEARVARLAERLQRAKRRVRALVAKCNALVAMEKERDALRSKLEALQAKHSLIIKPDPEALDKGSDAKDTPLKSASAAALMPPSARDKEASASTVEPGTSPQRSPSVSSGADLTEKYEKLKAQRDKLYQSYKAQKARIAELEEQEASALERLEKAERLYEETREELDIVTRRPVLNEGADRRGLFSWLGGGAQDPKSTEEEMLRARLDLLQQRLKKTTAENEALRVKQHEGSPDGTPRSSGKADQPKKAPSRLLPPGAADKEGEAGPLSEATAPQPEAAGPAGGAASSATLAELEKRIQEKETELQAQKEEILKLRTAASTTQEEGALKAELAQREAELKKKEAELERVKKDVTEKDELIRKKTEEVEALKVKVEALEKEKALAQDENNALKKQLDAVQKELEQLKVGAPSPRAAKAAGEKAATKVKRAASLTKRLPGLPAPARKAGQPDAAGAPAAAQNAPDAPADAASTVQAKEQPTEPEEPVTERDVGQPPAEESGDEVASKKKKKSKKKTNEEEKRPTDGDGKATKKKKKKKEVSSDPSDPETGTAATPAGGGWGFGLFGASPAATPRAPGSPPAKESNAPRASFLDLIVGQEHTEEPPKERELPPLKLSAVEGADEGSDSSSVEEAEGGIASTIAGMLWGPT